MDTGHEMNCKSITGGIFQAGFSDAILQMWGVYLAELGGEGEGLFGCVTPREAEISHALQTAALKSDASKTAEPVVPDEA